MARRNRVIAPLPQRHTRNRTRLHGIQPNGAGIPSGGWNAASLQLPPDIPNVSFRQAFLEFAARNPTQVVPAQAVPTRGCRGRGCGGRGGRTPANAAHTQGSNENEDASSSDLSTALSGSDLGRLNPNNNSDESSSRDKDASLPKSEPQISLNHSPKDDESSDNESSDDETQTKPKTPREGLSPNNPGNNPNQAFRVSPELDPIVDDEVETNANTSKEELAANDPNQAFCISPDADPVEDGEVSTNYNSSREEAPQANNDRGLEDPRTIPDYLLIDDSENRQAVGVPRGTSEQAQATQKRGRAENGDDSSDDKSSDTQPRKWRRTEDSDDSGQDQPGDSFNTASQGIKRGNDDDEDEDDARSTPPRTRSRFEESCPRTPENPPQAPSSTPPTNSSNASTVKLEVLDDRSPQAFTDPTNKAVQNQEAPVNGDPVADPSRATNDEELDNEELKELNEEDDQQQDDEAESGSDKENSSAGLQEASQSRRTSEVNARRPLNGKEEDYENYESGDISASVAAAEESLRPTKLN